MKFSNLISNEKVLKALDKHGIIIPTEIQEKAIPTILAGNDIIAKSQTGTGKTLAFTLPVLEQITKERYVQALIVCPTRELVLQVEKEINKYLNYVDGINICSVYGGARIDEQIRRLKSKPQIIIATPGRLIDHLNRKTVKVNNVDFVVLDEADEMISIGFKDELETILSHLKAKRQTLFFSATFPKKVANLASQYLSNPVIVEQSVKTQTVTTINQGYLLVNRSDKDEILKRFIFLNDDLSIVFCNTKKKVDEVVAFLQSFGIIAEAIHGDLNQLMRENVMKKMHNKILKVLVATDVAARGVDIKDVKHVYNYDFPEDFEYYVHRVGRTGRAGNSGTSYTFVTKKELPKLKMLERYTKSTLDKVEVPSINEVHEQRVFNHLNNLEFDCEDNLVIEELVSEGLTYKEIANALINERFSAKDFNSIGKVKVKEKQGKGQRKHNNRNKDELRLFINVGKRDNLKIKHIIGAFKSQTKLTEKDINNIDIKREFSFVSIPNRHKQEYKKITYINNRQVTIEKANN